MVLVEQIPDTEVALADTLTELVNNFRVDVILELTETILPSEVSANHPEG